MDSEWKTQTSVKLEKDVNWPRGVISAAVCPLGGLFVCVCVDTA